MKKQEFNKKKNIQEKLEVNFIEQLQKLSLQEKSLFQDTERLGINFQDDNKICQKQNQLIFKKQDIDNQRLKYQFDGQNTNTSAKNSKHICQTKQKKESALTEEQMNIYEEYKRDIQSKHGNYCKKEKPVVTFSAYKHIRNIWKKQKSESLRILKQTSKIKSLQNFTVEMMSRLKNKKWLNDEVINAYIQLINLEIEAFNNTIGKKQKQKSKNFDINIKVVNTFFAPLMNKQESKIERIIQKNSLTPDHIIIIPINQSNLHWFFVVIRQGHLQIFDSLSQKNTLANYKINDTILKVLNFMKSFYKQQKISKILSTFPQQSNGYDCGVMMLCGIHNFVQHFMNFIKYQSEKENQENLHQKKAPMNHDLLKFTFSQQDSLLKRYQFAVQIYNQKIQSFDW